MKLTGLLIRKLSVKWVKRKAMEYSFDLLMCAAKKLRCLRVTFCNVIMFHNNVTVLHNIARWCGKKMTKSSHSAVKCNSILYVLMCKVWVFEKEIITVFDVITFHISGRMVTEVYPCVIFS